jgi:pimeloyl-ACP methyl ester carboxylesterase
MSKLNRIILLISALATGFPLDGIAKIRPEAKFISATRNSEITFEMIRAFTRNIGHKKIDNLVKYGVRSYTVVYETQWKGKTIKASGLVLLPTGINEAAPIISVQHGTSFTKDEAPTVAGGFTGMELFAAAGFIVVMPDYIGYGSSSDAFHPYYDKTHSAYSVIDMVTAAREFLKKEAVMFNQKLFLGGYSEGGYVTLAAAAELESKAGNDFKLAAVAAGAGGYDLIHMLKGVTTESYYAYPAYLAFVLMSYNNTYDWNKPLAYFFKKQYADALAKYMNGSYGGWTINQHLTTNLPTLLDAEFYARLKKADGEIALKEALKKNSIPGWRTKTPIRLYHGTRDEIIPLQNSESTLKSFHLAGSNHVTLTTIPAGTHGSSLFPMLEQMIPWFVGLK